MPFTFSHPAIVLPLKHLFGKWFSLTGLVIGSLTPDFEYFIRMRIKSEISHTLSGLFWFNFPLGLITAFLFHLVLRDMLFDNLPFFLKSRVIVFKEFNWNTYFRKNWIIVLISILIGAASHLFWDSFTHVDGYFVQLFPELSSRIHFLKWQFPVFKLLQHGSTIFGAMVIVCFFYKLPVDIAVEHSVKVSYWLVFAAISILVLLVRFLVGFEINQIGNLVVTLIASILISLLCTPFFIRDVQSL